LWGSQLFQASQTRIHVDGCVRVSPFGDQARKNFGLVGIQFSVAKASDDCINSCEGVAGLAEWRKCKLQWIASLFGRAYQQSDQGNEAHNVASARLQDCRVHDCLSVLGEQGFAESCHFVSSAFPAAGIAFGEWAASRNGRVIARRVGVVGFGIF
jgi:hypothetical protein